jgi:hypothetical protein
MMIGSFLSAALWLLFLEIDCALKLMILGVISVVCFLDFLVTLYE